MTAGAKAAAVALLAAVAASASAQDATPGLIVDRAAFGAGACQAALPAFDGLVRKRPLAIQNEGDQGVFVTCAAPAFDWFTRDFGVEVRLSNQAAGTVTAHCTRVSYDNRPDPPTYLTRSVRIAPGGEVELRYLASNLFHTRTALSCMLPPGAGVTRLRTNLRVEL